MGYFFVKEIERGISLIKERILKIGKKIGRKNVILIATSSVLLGSLALGVGTWVAIDFTDNQQRIALAAERKRKEELAKEKRERLSKPKVSLVSKTPTFTIGNKFEAKNYITVSDNRDSIEYLEKHAKFNGLNTTKEGTYDVTIVVTDSDKNKTIKKVKFKVEKKPETKAVAFNDFIIGGQGFRLVNGIPADNISIGVWDGVPNYYLGDRITSGGAVTATLGIGSPITVQGKTYHVYRIIRGVNRHTLRSDWTGEDANSELDSNNYNGGMALQVCEDGTTDPHVRIVFAK